MKLLSLALLVGTVCVGQQPECPKGQHYSLEGVTCTTGKLKEPIDCRSIMVPRCIADEPPQPSKGYTFTGWSKIPVPEGCHANPGKTYYTCDSAERQCPAHSHYGGNLNCVADDGWVLKNSKDKVWAEPAPLKCGKYEHFIPPGAGETWVAGPDGKPVPGTRKPLQGECAPDLHVVTEKEWQELMVRLKKLEGKQ